MKRRQIYPCLVFFFILLFHVIYSIWESSKVFQQWAGFEEGLLWQSYFKQQDFFMGLSYALAGAFTVYALLKFSENRKSCVAGIIGGVTLIGVLNVAGCFLLGCCGSPMIAVYLSLFGSSFLGLAKPFVAAITAISVIFGFIWIRRTSTKELQS